MRKRVSDISLARSLVTASLREMQFLETVEPKIEAAATLIRGIYENFRRLGEALLAFQGFEGDHEDAIAALTQL